MCIIPLVIIFYLPEQRRLTLVLNLHLLWFCLIALVFFYWTNETEYYDSVTICLPNLSVQLMRFYGVFVIIPWTQLMDSLKLSLGFMSRLIWTLLPPVVKNSCCKVFPRERWIVNQAAGTKDLRLELPDLLLRGKNCSSYVIVTQQNTEWEPAASKSSINKQGIHCFLWLLL